MFIKIHSTEFNRNGVGGHEFYSCRFTLYEDGNENDLIAVIPDENPFPTDTSEVFVIDPEDLENKWRGDEIGELLLSLIDFQEI